MADPKPKMFKFRNDRNGRVFYATEGDAVYARVTGYDRADNPCLGEVNPKTLQLKGKEAKPEPKAKEAASTE